MNQWAKEQERLLVLTTKNLYRVKYDYKAKRVEHHERNDVNTIDMVHRGFLMREGALKKQPTFALRNGRQQFGFRVFAGKKKESKLTDKTQYMRTYLPLRTPSGDDGKGAVNAMVKALAAQIRRRTAAPANIVDVDLIVKDATGGVSTLYNKLGLGRWHSSSNSK